MDWSSSAVSKSDKLGDFRRWMANAGAGDRFTYYTGFLAKGIDAEGRRLPEADRKQFLVVAESTWAAAQRGLIHLLQRRLGDNCFEYFAVARPRRAESATPSIRLEVVR